MSAIRRIAALAALLGAGVLAGCGNSTDQGLVAKAVLSGLKPKPKVEMTPEQVNAAVAASLSQTDLPLALASLEGRQATVILATPDGETARYSVAELLPHSFDKSFLDRETP